MQIAVLGTGIVGETLADKLVAVGHDVFMGSRTTGNAKAVAWAARHEARAGHGTFADAAALGDVVVNATSGMASLAVLEAAGASNLDGKVLVDVSNPLDFSNGFPPSLSVCNTDSLGEQIQRAFPNARVVKALNTVTAAVMVDPGQLAGVSDLFIAGDDGDAKAVVVGLLGQFGWPESHVRDLGGITAARGTEMYLPLWLNVIAAVGTPTFNITLVEARQ